MRRFKQFLLKEEDVREHPNFQVSYTYQTDDVDTDVFRGTDPNKQFEHEYSLELNSAYQRDDISAEFNADDEITVYIPIRTQAETYKNDLEDHKFKCLKILKNTTRDDSISISDNYISVREAIPTGITLKWNEIAFYLPHSSLTSLSGIHKQLVCNELLFWRADKITHGALSIMKIKNIHNGLSGKSPIHRIAAMDVESKSCEWVKIINEGLKNGDDLIDVKELMMEKGLKELAKL